MSGGVYVQARLHVSWIHASQESKWNDLKSARLYACLSIVHKTPSLCFHASQFMQIINWMINWLINQSISINVKLKNIILVNQVSIWYCIYIYMAVIEIKSVIQVSNRHVWDWLFSSLYDCISCQQGRRPASSQAAHTRQTEAFLLSEYFCNKQENFSQTTWRQDFTWFEKEIDRFAKH